MIGLDLDGTSLERDETVALACGTRWLATQRLIMLRDAQTIRAGGSLEGGFENGLAPEELENAAQMVLAMMAIIARYAEMSPYAKEAMDEVFGEPSEEANRAATEDLMRHMTVVNTPGGEA